MIYTLFLYSSPFYSSLPWQAYDLVRVLLKKKQHGIHAAFFYADAVRIADKTLALTRNNLAINQAWSDLAETGQLSCHFCISSAVKRNLISEDGKNTQTVLPGFTLSSLTEFIALKQQSEEVLVF